jgi:hypothetical protein
MPREVRAGQRGLRLACFAATLTLSLAPTAVLAAVTRPVDIPAQPLSTALLALSRQTGTIIIAPAGLVRDARRRPCAVAWSRPRRCDAFCAARALACRSAATG